MMALVVEESRAMRAILKKQLSDVGFDVHVRNTLWEGLEFLQSHPHVPLVLLEADMMGDDENFMRRLKHHQGARFLIVAGEAEMALVQEAMQAGADGFLPKPFTPDMMLQKLKELDIAPPQQVRKAIHVLVVDDAIIARRLLTQVIEAEPALHLVGTAVNGERALVAIDELKPDIVTLDVEMPVMDGLESLAEIRKRWPKLPVIMVSSITERGAAATLEALALGATDYVTKPSSSVDFDDAAEKMRGELIWRLKHFGAPAPAPIEGSILNVPPSTKPTVVELVAIGTSTGGPEALATVLTELPAQFPVPIVVVQHMPPMFTRLLAERLTARGSLPMAEGQHGEVLEPGRVYIAPGDYHMRVVRKGTQFVLELNQEERENSCRPAVDVLFRSVAQACGAHTLAVIMTGMGQDGLLGCEQLRAVHAQILAQDEASSVVWGMPGYVVRAGFANKVLPLGMMATEITRRVLALRP